MMRVAVAAAITTMLLSCNTTQSKPVIATDLCELSRKSAAFDGKVVTLRAAVLSDLIEHTFLVSTACPSETVSLAVAADAEGGEFLKAAMVDVMPNGTVAATFTGRFEWDANETPARVLNVHAVRDLVANK